MNIPFTISEFLEVFKKYNEGVFPAQIIAYLLGFVVIGLLLKPSKYSDKIINGIVASFWVWMGIVYHLVYFAAINDAAIIFGIVFILQGLLFLIVGVLQAKTKFRLDVSRLNIATGIAIALILYSMVIYPILNQLLGHSYPNSPMFGLAPCPTVIFTFGILLLNTQKVPGYLLIIPFLWSLIGFSAAVNLGIIEDFGLVIAGILGLIFILRGNRKNLSPTKG